MDCSIRYDREVATTHRLLHLAKLAATTLAALAGVAKALGVI
jgi:hypothetical protein